jgi:large subunit ribosomal protein L23
MNRQGKRKRYGYKIGKRKDTKRAVVTLASGDSIDLFGV